MSTQAVRQRFAQQVNEARLKRHLSVRAAARIAGVPAATVQGWLSGEHYPAPPLRDNYLRLIARLGLLAQLPSELRSDFAE